MFDYIPIGIDGTGIIEGWNFPREIVRDIDGGTVLIEGCDG